MAASIAKLATLRSATTKLLSRAVPVTFNSRAGYAVKKVTKGKAKGGAGAITQQKHYDDLETDPVRLTTMLCGGNILKDGPDPVLKEDHEYPEWLWTLHTDRDPVPIEDLDPNTREYWKRVRAMDNKKTRLLQKSRSKWGIY